MTLSVHDMNIQGNDSIQKELLQKESEIEIARKLSFSGAVDPVVSKIDDKVQIVIRIRPVPSNKKQDQIEADESFRVVSATDLLVKPPTGTSSYRSTGSLNSFQFSRIFAKNTPQEDLFEATTKPVIEAAFEGKNGLVFAYGVTNSGKTYTISGTEEQPGVLPRALKLIFQEIENRMQEHKHQLTLQASESDENESAKVSNFEADNLFIVTASYLEVYNEFVYDLLVPTTRRQRSSLRLQDCGEGQIQVKGLQERPIHCLQDAEELLKLGKRNKQVAETKCNIDSSRSHCVFTLHFYHKQNANTNGNIMASTRMQTRSSHQIHGGKRLYSKVSIVDLAGAEKSSKTGATGIRMAESSKINGSLMNLMRCLETLRWNQHHPAQLQRIVPFRQSKLTRLFQESLVGKKPGPLVMIVAVNPSSQEFDETLRTLKFCAITKGLVLVHEQQEQATITTTSQSQQQQQQQRTKALGSHPSTMYYDLDGRLKKKRKRNFIDVPAENNDIQQNQNKNKSTIQDDQTVTSIHNSSTKQNEPLKELQKRLHLMEEENGQLKNQFAFLQREKLSFEMSLRNELASEMAAQLKQLKNHFHLQMIRQKEDFEEEKKRLLQIIQTYQQQQNSSDATTTTTATKFSSNSHNHSTSTSTSTSTSSNVECLQEQLKECEEEMKRMQVRHEQEMALLKSTTKSKKKKKKTSNVTTRNRYYDN